MALNAPSRLWCQRGARGADYERHFVWCFNDGATGARSDDFDIPRSSSRFRGVGAQTVRRARADDA
jgi:hypothetical protein